MKKITFLLTTVMIVLLTACGTSNKVVDQQQADAIKALLESREYVVMVGSMRPISAPTMSVSQGQKMFLRDGMVTCNLPYVGSGQNVGYGASGYKALNFTGRVLDYKVEYPKSDRARVTFKVDNGDDSYHFHVEVFMNGKTTIDVDPRGRDAISYSGMIHGLEML
ncbi:MAG: DUF4251 domain-containing protein [Muribaculaceae bacterium]|jgi:hypothetical protein|nr:DUF4251 domain-containing protein [Muribaculaceae bacterium]